MAVLVVTVAAVWMCDVDVLVAAADPADAVVAEVLLFNFALLLLFGGGPKSVGDTLSARTSRFFAAPSVFCVCVCVENREEIRILRLGKIYVKPPNNIISSWQKFASLIPHKYIPLPFPRLPKLPNRSRSITCE